MKEMKRSESFVHARVGRVDSRTSRRVHAFLVLALALTAALLAACSSGGDQTARDSLRSPTSTDGDQNLDIAALFAGECVVNMAPRHYDPRNGKFPSTDDLREDIRLLGDAGFTGVATYTAAGSLAEIPRLAKDAGFSVVVMGVWDPRDAEELDAAVREKGYVDGYLIGSEGITDGRYVLQELAAGMERVRRETGRPVSTTDTLAAYRSNPGLWRLGDGVSVNAHPWWAGLRDPGEAGVWVGREYAAVAAEARHNGARGRLIFRELGWPSAGDAATSEEAQAEFLRQVQGEDIIGAVFEAFDAQFKQEFPVEPHWGAFHADGTPKRAASVVCEKDVARRLRATTPAQAPTAPPATSSPPTTAPNVLQTATLGYGDFELNNVCTDADNFCTYADRLGKAVIYGSMSIEVPVPASATNLTVEVAIPCNGWGEGLAGPPGSRARVIVDNEAREEVIDASMPFHHNGHYKYEFCSKFSHSFSIASRSAANVRMEVIDGARMDFQTAILTFTE